MHLKTIWRNTSSPYKTNHNVNDLKQLSAMIQRFNEEFCLMIYINFLSGYLKCKYHPTPNTEGKIYGK